jgi:hypothetical protein
MITKDFNSWIPFIGIVEDVDDPKKLGRAKVRVINHHDDDVETEELDWATPIMPNSASREGVGTSPTFYGIGSVVFGFYFDGKQRSLPMILGSIAKIPENDDEKHDVHKRARGINKIKNKETGPEPKPQFKAKYPFNKVISTPSGHIIELDDTKDGERINVRHKSGSYVEINNEGRMVIKAVDDLYVIAAGDENIYADKKLKIESKKDMTLVTKGKLNINVDGDCKVTSKKTIRLKAKKVDLMSRT